MGGRQSHIFLTHRLLLLLLLLPSWTAAAVEVSSRSRHTPMTERRLGVLDVYKPRIVPEWLCSQQEKSSVCKEMDEAVLGQREKAASASGWGTLVVMLQFQDHSDRPLVRPRDIELLFNAVYEQDDTDVTDRVDDSGSNGQHTRTPVPSVHTYFQANSFGRFNTKATVIPWTVPIATRFADENLTATQNDCLGSNEALRSCLDPVLYHLDALHQDTNQPFDWRHVDQNRDGIIDNLVVLHSGYHFRDSIAVGNNNENTPESNLDPGTAVDNLHLAPYTAAMPGTLHWHSNVYRVHLQTYTVMSAFESVYRQTPPDDDNSADTAATASNDDTIRRQPTIPLHIVLREFMHAIGFPDLVPANPEREGYGTGIYSLLSSPNSVLTPAVAATRIGMLDPWTRYKLGWIRPIEITANGRFESLPSAISSNSSVYIISEPYPKGEYLLVENRATLLFDGHLPAEGLLIWHVDERIRGNYRSGGPFQSDWPRNGRHYQVRVVQADGNFDLERGINPGDVGDYFQTNSPRLGPSVPVSTSAVARGDSSQATPPSDSGTRHLRNLNVFNFSAPASDSPPPSNPVFPNTDSYQGATMKPTGIVIGNFTTFDPTGVKLFDVSGFEDAAAVGTDVDVGNDGEILDSYADKCLVQVNTRYCDELVDIFLEQQRQRRALIANINAGSASTSSGSDSSNDECACYQWCGDSGEATCCPFGKACEINCPSGRFVAGCILPVAEEDEGSDPEVEPPKFEPVTDAPTISPPSSGTSTAEDDTTPPLLEGNPAGSHSATKGTCFLVSLLVTIVFSW